MKGQPGGRVAHLYRHPIKAVGREAVDTAHLLPDAPFPHDRIWAVRHSNGQVPPGAWAKCSHFTRGAKVPALMAITARYTPDTRRIRLSHPDRPMLTIAPDSAQDKRALIDWLDPLVPPDLPRPAEVMAAPAQGFTDAPYASVAILSLASLRAVSHLMGKSLSRHRFRANIWLDGADPWAEADLVGQEISLGTARLQVTEPIYRCRATMADPDTGQIDAPVLDGLTALRGDAIFGVYARVVGPGTLHIGDSLS